MVLGVVWLLTEAEMLTGHNISTSAGRNGVKGMLDPNLIKSIYIKGYFHFSRWCVQISI
jgi:hypothetical protein